MKIQPFIMAFLTLLVGCAGAQMQPGRVTPDDRFESLRDEFYWAHLEARPSLGVYLGYHQYDGQLPSVSSDALKDEIGRLERARKSLEAVDASRLSEMHQIERDALLFEIRSQLFDLTVIRAPWRNPGWYGWPMSVSNYVVRDYAPISKRAEAIIEVAGGIEQFLSDARANLEEELPAAWVETGLLQVRGNIEFIETDVREQMKGLDDPRLEQRLSVALDQMVSELRKHEAFLEGRLKNANQDYALGEDMFLRMLAETQGVTMTLDELKAVATADLERNLKAMREAAAEIDPDEPVADVIHEVLNDKPAADGVLAEAESQAARMRAFILDHDIVSIPSEDRAEVRASPPFMRWNSAFLSGAGPFETAELPSFYYISPPDPSWSKDEQRAYIPGKTDLLATTIHELWPGHFLHGLHTKQVDSAVLKTFWNYAMGEGWAHYTEEMMVNQGVGDGDPRVRIGQLINALLRDTRFLAAIGLHAEGMTVEEAETLFREKAFQDPGNARQQAKRGTHDPMYLSYTLGKLMILKLRADWKKEQGDDYTLKRFHDGFLSYGGAPVPVIRKAMLEDDSGDVL